MNPAERAALRAALSREARGLRWSAVASLAAGGVWLVASAETTAPLGAWGLVAIGVVLSVAAIVKRTRFRARWIAQRPVE